MHPEYIELNNQRLFACWTQHKRLTDHLTVVIPPFAEEMNKCRHLLSELRQQLIGHSDLLLLDPYGTGDSSGDLDTATAQQWTSDWLSLLHIVKTAGYQKINVVAVRYGHLQLIDLLQQVLPLPIHKIVLWQPYLQSSTFLQQFFRLKIAEQMAKGEKTTQKELEAQLNAGDMLEIAGYPITHHFVSSVHSLQGLDTLPALYQQTPLLWLETSMLQNVSPACEKGIASLSPHFLVQFQQLLGPPWWNASELVYNSELIDRTCEFLTGNPA
jgi:exosortase A-associated hydrolase 2